MEDIDGGLHPAVDGQSLDDDDDDDDEYRLCMDRWLPSNISLILRTSMSLSADLWISVAGYMFFTKIRGPPVGHCSSYVFRVRDFNHMGWAPLRLGDPAQSLPGYP